MDHILSIVLHRMIQHDFLTIIRNFGIVLQYTRECQSKLTLEFLEWYSRPYMNTLFPPTGNPFLIDKVYLGYSLDILEYRTMDTQFRVRHLPKGHIWVVQLDFTRSNKV